MVDGCMVDGCMVDGCMALARVIMLEWCSEKFPSNVVCKEAS